MSFLVSLISLTFLTFPPARLNLNSLNFSLFSRRIRWSSPWGIRENSLIFSFGFTIFVYECSLVPPLRAGAGRVATNMSTRPSFAFKYFDIVTIPHQSFTFKTFYRNFKAKFGRVKVLLPLRLRLRG